MQNSLTTFKHVQHTLSDEQLQEGRAVIIVQFDSEWELWFSQKPYNEAVAKKCYDELEQHFKEEWHGTHRLIPCIINGVYQGAFDMDH